MADFRGMLCWDPAVAAATINTEAVSPSRAVFLATHTRLRIKRAKISSKDGLDLEDVTITEDDVLKEFLSLNPDSGALLLPVVGDSGSGKSHLVRWVREMLTHPDRETEKLKVIYLEKSKTSLRSVIKTLASDARSIDLAQLIEDIDKFTEDIDEKSLARRILNELSEALEATPPGAESRPYARMLVGSGKLAAFLLDPHVREELLAEGKFVPELARRLINNRRVGEQDRPERFAISDLPLEFEDHQKVSGMAKMMLGMISTQGALQAVAVELLNSHLEDAVKRAFNLGAGRLLDAMREVREEYHRQGKEIVLLIEDFALIQGVQRDLLDAVVEAANREGATSLAPIRTLMAVTPGYFDTLPDTVLTRLQAGSGFVYHLDVPFSPKETGEEEITKFVGRYLNAGRVGREALENAVSEVPNKCSSCPLESECHEAFGSTEDGYGLYPFNASALVRAVHSTSPKDKPWSFVPRVVLGGVVREVLEEHAGDIRQGTFPSPRFRQSFRPAEVDEPLSREVRNLVEENDPDPVSRERRNLVLEFWGDSPARADDIHPIVLEAFSLERLVGDDREGPSPVSPPPAAPLSQPPTNSPAQAPSATPPQREVPAQTAKMLAAVDQWLTREGILDTNTANRIRGIVWTAVVERYQWTAPLMRQQPITEVIKKAWPTKATAVSIEGAKENLPGVEDAPITFSRSPGNSWFFDSLIRADEKLTPRSVDIRRLATLAEKHSTVLTTRLQTYMEIHDKELVVGLRASLLGAALAGKAWPGMSKPLLVAIALDDGREWRREDDALRTEKWLDLLDRHLNGRPALVARIRQAVGVAQGIGAVTMIDGARLLPLLDRASSSWSWDVGGRPAPSWVRPAIPVGFASWHTLIDAQLARLDALLTETRAHHPSGSNGNATMSALREALPMAAASGLPLSYDEKQQLDGLLQECEDADWSSLTALERDLSRANNEELNDVARLNARLVAAAKDRGGSLDAIRRLLVASANWLDAALASAESRSSTPAANSAVEEVRLIRKEWKELVASWADQTDVADKNEETGDR
ncbi:ATP-binding protein [Streptomyces sp. 3MP-14]|uniref:ATP-binding protein n=1 Tax=Streptomyces mimosae TaxID=2586635 RepID=A0A5N6ARR5_9ACTN|nr:MULTISPECIES: protein DpdH [Streptomyces]KAB8170793.1 ATP-binding protein [Streptomyces mimosae]KAB8179854.1 ATP-binding protein [Streptomyces sp. 3MP-14]